LDRGPTPSEPAPLITRHSLREKRRCLRILLAEDNVVNQMVAVRMLENQGHTVVTVSNGHAVLEALAQPGFDLVLMDVQMPDLDGLEATAIIREQEQHDGTHIPIIAMTAHAMQGDRERCLAAGMDDYISKPMRATDLYATIERLLQDPPAPPIPTAQQSVE
ncbi:MAG TPA: response regulator, partial [Candidatus Tectomicrobia bacterium]